DKADRSSLLAVCVCYEDQCVECVFVMTKKSLNVNEETDRVRGSVCMLFNL
ncbi:Hypothetical predicted protein, partial [Pelobates cultripes]